MTEKQEQRLLALRELLSRVDAVDLVGKDNEHRGHHYTQPRNLLLDRDIIKRDFATAYITWRRQEHQGGDISCVISLRRERRLRLASGQ